MANTRSAVHGVLDLMPQSKLRRTCSSQYILLVAKTTYSAVHRLSALGQEALLECLVVCLFPLTGSREKGGMRRADRDICLHLGFHIGRRTNCSWTLMAKYQQMPLVLESRPIILPRAAFLWWGMAHNLPPGIAKFLCCAGGGAAVTGAAALVRHRTIQEYYL